MQFLIILFLTLISSQTLATELFDGDYNLEYFHNRTKIIEPDVSVYGLKFGSTEEEIINEFGKPNGVISANWRVKILLYGKRHWFYLIEGKFQEIVYSLETYNSELDKSIKLHPFFDDTPWVLEPHGITLETSYKEIETITGNKLFSEKFPAKIKGKISTTSIYFKKWMRDHPDLDEVRLLIVRNPGKFW
ncbi:MAG: hypothetical protein O7D86_08480 [Proteobacteria bacterium]|nr:hypothetical protein [Pseudomonadota bacterium]